MLHSLTIRQNAWSDASPDHTGDSLITTIHVNGCPVHLMAEAVTTESDGCQVGVGASNYAELAIGFELNAPLETTKIKGREYALFAVGHGR